MGVILQIIDSSSVGALSRKHQNFLKDIDAIGAQVQQIENDTRYLKDSYAGDSALTILSRENEVLKVRVLLLICFQH